jgi:hypothetical protein
MPASVLHLITGSLGGALAISKHIGGLLGSELAALARSAFVSGLDLAVTVGAIVVGVASIAVLVTLPNRGGPPAADESAEDVAN